MSSERGLAIIRDSELALLEQAVGFNPELPKTLVVAGIRDSKSLGWIAAQKWLEQEPNGNVIATFRSEPAEDFLDTKQQEYPDRITTTRIDWLDPNARAKLGQDLTLMSIKLGGLQIGGVVHSVAGADKSNFSNKPSDIDPNVYLNAFMASTVSLTGLVHACKRLLVPNAGIVTFGYGDPQRTDPGYGGAMEASKAALTKLVRSLAVELGRGGKDGARIARIIEITTGYIETRSGRGVAAAQGIRSKEIAKRSEELAALADSTSISQANAAGDLAVLFIRNSAFWETTGHTIPVDGGASIISPSVISS